MNQRFKIAPEKLLILLNAGMGKKIGVSARTNLLHRLVWSDDDEVPLVAIQDVVNGTLLTVLTIEMYRREYPENLTESRLRHVVNQMVYAGLVPIGKWNPGDKEECVTVYAMFSYFEYCVALGRWKGELLSADLTLLGKDVVFWDWVAKEISKRNHALEDLLQVHAKFSGGDHQAIPYALSN